MNRINFRTGIDPAVYSDGFKIFLGYHWRLSEPHGRCLCVAANTTQTPHWPPTIRRRPVHAAGDDVKVSNRHGLQKNTIFFLYCVLRTTRNPHGFLPRSRSFLVKSVGRRLAFEWVGRRFRARSKPTAIRSFISWRFHRLFVPYRFLESYFGE